MDFSLGVALVTGANRGIGNAVVQALVARGVSKIYAGTRNPTSLETGGRIVPVELDICDKEQVQAAAKRCADVTILINNAGIARMTPLLWGSDDSAAREEMRVNYFGTLGMCRAFAPILKGNGGGVIVNVISLLARVSLPQLGSYAASKAALYSLTQGIRGELAPQGTRVIGVLPGLVDTEMTKRINVPKMTAPEVADAIVDALADSESSDIYPGSTSDIASLLQRDPVAVERRFATLLPSLTR